MTKLQNFPKSKMSTTYILVGIDHRQDHLQGLQVHHGFLNQSMICLWEWNQDQWQE
jgi:hypothetical protein